MSAYGTVVSQVGFDVDTCGDSQLVYSSEWPLLKIAHQDSYLVTDATQDVTLYTHGLSYIPKFMAYDRSSPGSRLVSPGVSQYIGVDGTSIKWLGATRFAPAGAVQLYLYVYREDMARSFTAQNIETTKASATAYDQFGIIISKDGFSVESDDMRNIAIHSNARSPMIHKSGTFSFGAAGGSETITHNLQHEPMFFVWSKLSLFGDGYWSLISTADDCYATSTTTATTIISPYEGDYSYIIFKDPILLD